MLFGLACTCWAGDQWAKSLWVSNRRVAAQAEVAKGWYEGSLGSEDQLSKTERADVLLSDSAEGEIKPL